MNLDIMSLMAASAAVSDGRSAPGAQSGAIQPLLDETPNGTSFTSMLQALTDHLENINDVISDDIRDVTLTPDEMLVGLSGDAASSADPQVAAPTPDLLTGSLLPDNGNGLPPTDLEGIAETGLSPANELIRLQTSVAQPPDTTSAAVAARASVDTRQLNAPRGQPVTQPAGWFSQRSAPTSASPIPLTTDARAAIQAQDAALRPDLRAAPATEAAPLNSAFAQIRAAEQTTRPGAGVLADRLQALATQSATIGQNPVASEPAGLEAPRGSAPQPLNSVSAATGVTTASMPAALSAPINLNQAGWDRALGQRLVFMAAKGLDSAELRLDPPQLGTVHVKLSMQGDQAQVLLQAANPLAREAMETALPRLRDMLGAEGLQLDSAQVTDRDNPQRQRHSGAEPEHLADTSDDEGAGPAGENALTRVESLTTTDSVISEKV